LGEPLQRRPKVLVQSIDRAAGAQGDADEEAQLEQQALDQRREQLQPQKSKGGRPTKEAENLKAELEQKTAETEAKDAEIAALKAEMEQLKAQQSLEAGHSQQEGQQHG
jgi:chromosome segregation ATPase